MPENPAPINLSGQIGLIINGYAARLSTPTAFLVHNHSVILRCMARYSLLIVEDEHTLRRLLEYRLSKQYHVRTAANGEEALERIAEEIPNLIISDIMMPRMDGVALQAKLQKHKDTRAIPFIFK